MNPDVRWKQRFQNFERAVSLLAEPCARGLARLSDLEQEGTVQRFELAVELGWKVLKDYLEQQGTIVQPVTPRAVVKSAFAAGILTDGQAWIDMLLDRNLLSHTYERATLERVLGAIADRYLAVLVELRGWLAARVAE